MIIKEKDCITTFFDAHLAASLARGEQWGILCQRIISTLPQEIYISFDIDGLDPYLCPHTGTPVPGGPRFHEISYLMNAIGKSGKRIVGFDVSEVAPGTDEWDGNVGARILWLLCGNMIRTN